jgi:hypothetical protein
MNHLCDQAYQPDVATTVDQIDPLATYEFPRRTEKNPTESHHERVPKGEKNSYKNSERQPNPQAQEREPTMEFWRVRGRGPGKSDDMSHMPIPPRQLAKWHRGNDI